MDFVDFNKTGKTGKNKGVREKVSKISETGELSAQHGYPRVILAHIYVELTHLKYGLSPTGCQGAALRSSYLSILAFRDCPDGQFRRHA